MKFAIHALLISFLLFVPFAPHHIIAGDRGSTVQVRTKKGKTIDLYHESHALVIGNGNYDNGWGVLPGALKDVDEVAAALEKKGFSVTKAMDLTKAKFERLFSTFVRQNGRDKNNKEDGE